MQTKVKERTRYENLLEYLPMTCTNPYQVLPAAMGACLNDGKPQALKKRQNKKCKNEKSKTECTVSVNTYILRTVSL